MSDVSVAQDLLELFDSMAGLNPYEPLAMSLITRLIAEAGGGQGQLREARSQVEVIDALRALHKLKQRAPEPPELFATTPGFSSSHARPTHEVLYEAIEQARSSVLLLAYDLSSEELLSRLHQFTRQPGVSLHLVVNHEVKLERVLEAWPEDARREHISAWRYAQRADMEREHQGQRTYPPLHAKALVVDHCSCLIGSANMTWSGLNQNVELGVLLKNKTLATSIWSFYESIPRELLVRVSL